MTNAVKSETSESFAVMYYNSYPIGTRPPQEKLSDGAADDDEKVTLLLQKRTLSQMIFGETSSEAIRATTELGAFYNAHKKPHSTEHNLSKARQSAKQTGPQVDDSFTLTDVILSTAWPKAEKTKQFALADAELSSCRASPNALNAFHRNLFLGRIQSYRARWEESFAFYEKAIATHPAVHAD
jgi:hypothetical protein